MIERMLASGGVTVGESYEVQENGKTVTVRSIGPAREQSEPIRDEVPSLQLREVGSSSHVPKSRGS